MLDLGSRGRRFESSRSDTREENMPLGIEHLEVRMQRGDAMVYVLDYIKDLIMPDGSIVKDNYSITHATAVAEFLESEGETKAQVHHTNPERALAQLLVGLGVWYSGGDIHIAVDAAGALAESLKDGQ